MTVAGPHPKYTSQLAVEMFESNWSSY